MKLLVGILFCIENEINQCIDSIKKQTHQNFEYFIIKNLPNKEAHDKLYKTFMENRKVYDLFIKIDADMVLLRPTFFDEVVSYITINPDIDDLQIAVHDFFTDRLIYGLHVYSNRMCWQQDNEQIFVDWPEKVRSYKQANDKSVLAPAAEHCPNPSNFQAFHYGLHKVVKITQYDNIKLRYWACLVHWDNIMKIIENFNSDKDNIALAYAILGAYEGIKRKITAEHLDFQNQYTTMVFSTWKSKEKSDVISFVKRLCKLQSIFPQNFLLQLILLPRYSRKGWVPAIHNMIKNIKFNHLKKYQENHLL